MAKRRRRRQTGQVLAARTIKEIAARKRTFLREASQLLTEALGFTVRVSLVPPKEPTTPDMRRAARRPAAENRRHIAESFNRPIGWKPPRELDDDLPF